MTLMRILNPPFLLILSVGSTIGRAEAQTPSDSLPRCYALSFGSWSIGSEPLDLYQPLATRIALTSYVFERRHTGTSYWGIRWPTDKLRRVAVWTTTGSDTVNVQLPSLWSTGIELTLTHRADSLIGQALVYVDYYPNSPTSAPVVASPVPCPSSVKGWRPNQRMKLTWPIE